MLPLFQAVSLSQSSRAQRGDLAVAVCGNEFNGLLRHFIPRNDRVIKFAVISPLQSSRAQRGDLAVAVCGNGLLHHFFPRNDRITKCAMTALLSLPCSRHSSHRERSAAI